MDALVFATQNPGKVKEMRRILADLNIVIKSADEAGFTQEIEETGETFEENALLKARIVVHKLNIWTVADDTGLCVEALEGKPGVHSSRWAGNNTSDREKVDFLLKKMISLPYDNRNAYFETVVALVSPKCKVTIFKGRIYGTIPFAPQGTNRLRLPYDTIFIPDGYSKTFAEMTDDKKNSISHRGKAFSELKKYLQKLNGK